LIWINGKGTEDPVNALPVIHATTLFRGISADGTKQLASRARLRTYRPGETVVSETDSVKAFYVVVSGQVKLYKSSAEGKEQTLYLLGPGEPFGLCTAFAIESFPANVTSLEESVLLILPGADVEEVAMKEPVLFECHRGPLRRLKESCPWWSPCPLRDPQARPLPPP
jgi:CRP/FNR family transcriptional regulator